MPIRAHHWDVSQLDFIEADTVTHCGKSLISDFIWSLTMADIQTTWAENRATWNKGQQACWSRYRTLNQLAFCAERL